MPFQPMPLTPLPAFVGAPRSAVAARAAMARRLGLPGLLAVLLAGAGGCQFGPGVQRQQLIQHQALIDFSGLKPAEGVEAVRVQASPPGSWVLHGIERHALYNHQQWKSPTARTAVGVIYARMPLPLSPDTLLWLGRQQYSKQSDDGKEVSNWTDSVGRRWFEAETKKYHARGYAIVNGLDAWIVYMGYKTDAAPEPADVSLAARCVEMFVPVKSGEPFGVPMSTQKVTPVTEPAAGTKPSGPPATAPASAASSSPAATHPAAVEVKPTAAPSAAVTAADVLRRLSQTVSDGRSASAPAK